MRKFALSVLPFVLLAACSRRGPSRPELIGPTSGRPGDALSYAVTSTDPDGKDVAYRFDWGDSGIVLKIGRPTTLAARRWLECTSLPIPATSQSA